MRIVWTNGERPAAAPDGPRLRALGLGAGVPLLAERYRVLAFDNRGIGESDKPGARTRRGRWRTTRCRCSTKRASSGPTSSASSLGGMVAQELVIAAPERVDKLVLGCTQPGGADGYPMPEVTVRLFQEGPSKLTPRRRSASSSRTRSVARGAVVEEVYAGRLANPPDPAGWQAQAAAGATFAGVDQSLIAEPTLVITGTDDNVVDPRNSDVLAERIPGARLGRVEGTGHLFFWEQPVEVVKIVERLPPMSVSPTTIDKILRDRARITPARVAIDFTGRELDLRRARRALRRARRAGSRAASGSRP